MSELSGKTALVTGATGFIGGALARRLLEHGADVHAVSRASQPRGPLRFWQVDVGDPSAIARLLDDVRPELVFDLASLVLGAREAQWVLPTLRASLLGPLHLLTAAQGRGRIRLIFAGSLEEPQPDGSWPTPASPYAAAKFAAGAYARMFHALYGTDVVWLRLFMVYGPGQLDTRKLIPSVILSFLRGERPRLSSGTRPVDWVFIDDVVDAFLAAARAEAPGAAPIDIGTGSLSTIREVVTELGRIVGSQLAPEYGAVADRPLEQVRRADVDASRRRLGWSARTALPEGLRKTVEWYRQRGLP